MITQEQIEIVRNGFNEETTPEELDLFLTDNQKTFMLKLINEMKEKGRMRLDEVGNLGLMMKMVQKEFNERLPYSSCSYVEKVQSDAVKRMHLSSAEGRYKVELEIVVEFGDKYKRLFITMDNERVRPNIVFFDNVTTEENRYYVIRSWRKRY